MKKSMMFTALGLGAAYLMRNKDARTKLMNQVQQFTSSRKRTNSPTV